jgi:hypothetical protein
MRRQRFNHDQLSRLCKFTDPFMHYPEKEQEILKYYEANFCYRQNFCFGGSAFLIDNFIPSYYNRSMGKELKVSSSRMTHTVKTNTSIYLFKGLHKISYTSCLVEIE